MFQIMYQIFYGIVRFALTICYLVLCLTDLGYSIKVIHLLMECGDVVKKPLAMSTASSLLRRWSGSSDRHISIIHILRKMQKNQALRESSRNREKKIAQ